MLFVLMQVRDYKTAYSSKIGFFPQWESGMVWELHQTQWESGTRLNVEAPDPVGK